MTLFRATFLRVKAQSNPEDSFVLIEAADDKEAEKKAKALLKEPESLEHTGWRSFRDTEMWGKEMPPKLVDVKMLKQMVTREMTFPEQEALSRNPD